MSGLVDDLILLSRLDAHRLAVGCEQIDVIRVVRSVQQQLSGLIANRAIAVRINAADALLPVVQANLNHLRVVLRNLLENGLKYTPTGGSIVITLAQGGQFLCCSVQDNGQGIAPSELPHVSKRFHRAAQARQRQSIDEAAEDEFRDGSGLGLALVQSIVALYGGRLEITSPGVNQGTTATVWWPFVQKR